MFNLSIRCGDCRLVYLQQQATGCGDRRGDDRCDNRLVYSPH